MVIRCRSLGRFPILGLGSLDYATPLESAAYWKSCGAKVGVYRLESDSIEWEA